MKFATIKSANETIDRIKEEGSTFYFGQTVSNVLPKYLSFAQMKDMFKSCGFADAETNLILASLVKAGCKFTI